MQAFLNFSKDLLDGLAASGIFQRIFGAAFEFGDLLRREFGVEFLAEAREDLVLFLEWQLADLFQNLGRTHDLKISRH